MSEEQNNLFEIGDLVLISDRMYRWKDKELAVITGFSSGIGGLWDIYRVYYIKKNVFEKCYNSDMELISKA